MENGSYQVQRSISSQTYQRYVDGKVATLNPNCKRFNAIYKRLRLVGRSGENDNDLMRRARKAYRDESKLENKSFIQDGAWEVLKQHVKWDSPDPVDSVDLTGHFKLFGDDPRPRPSGNPRASKKTKSKS